MPQSESNVLILKPTPVFLSFLEQQFPDIDVFDPFVLKTDNTAYTIRKQESDEAMFDEIERLYPSMFQYEVSRLLGDDADFDIEGSFVDFLRCFKFELYSQVVPMESPSEDHSSDKCRELKA